MRCGTDAPFRPFDAKNDAQFEFNGGNHTCKRNPFERFAVKEIRRGRDVAKRKTSGHCLHSVRRRTPDALVPFDDPLAGGTGATLQDCDGRDIAVYRIYGAFEQEIASFLERLEKSRNVTVYTDYFIFRQMLKHKNVLTFTTLLVQLYRNDGRRVIIPLEEKGVSATYHLCFLRTNKKRLEPVTAWIRENAAILKY